MSTAARIRSRRHRHDPRVDPARRTAIPRRSRPSRTARDAARRCRESRPRRTRCSSRLPRFVGRRLPARRNGRPAPRGPMAHFFMVSPDYLDVMGMPVLRGRGIWPQTIAPARRPCSSSARRLRSARFPAQDAVGRRIEWNDGTWEIVGRHGRHPPRVAQRSLRRRRLRAAPPGRARQHVAPAQDRRPAAAILAELQERVKAIDPDVALTDAATMAARLAKSAAPERFRAIVTGTLAGLTLLLAIVGLHGVVSYAVSSARGRSASGSRLVSARPPFCVSCCSIRCGPFRRARCLGSCSVYAGRWLSSVVMVNADQTAALSGVVAIFVAAALAAAAGPAWRASRVDPIVALRTS